MRAYPTPFSVLVLLATLGAGAPCSAASPYGEETFRGKALPAYTIATPRRGGPPADTVIGELRLYRIRPGDTLMDLARYFDLGYNEIVEANPAIDPWVPPVGATILLPTQWVLPCCSYEGVVVNIPEMRLFFYRRSDDPGRTIVHTFPVGLGRDEWRTPRGKFKVRGKTLNPQWNIPESIRREHITERGDHRRFIPGGAEDNPLGRHRIELTLPMYAIHGTNIPWGVGMQVSHGCIRLYPEDIERLFPLVRPGIPGEFTYQPVTIGTRDGAVYVEAHRDIYGYTPARYSEAMQAIERAGLGARVDRDLLVAVLEESVGIPTRVSPAEDVPGGRPAATPATLASRERLETDDHRVSRPHDDQARHD